MFPQDSPHLQLCIPQEEEKEECGCLIGCEACMPKSIESQNAEAWKATIAKDLAQPFTGLNTECRYCHRLCASDYLPKHEAACYRRFAVTYRLPGVLVDAEELKIEYPDETVQVTRASILEEASRLTMGDRNKSYGDPTTRLRIFENMVDWFLESEAGAPAGVIGACIACLDKLSRIAVNPKHADNYVDLAAYAAIAGEAASKWKGEGT